MVFLAYFVQFDKLFRIQYIFVNTELFNAEYSILHKIFRKKSFSSLK